MSKYLAQLKKLENGGEGTLKNLKNPPAIGSLGFLGTPTPAFSKNQVEAQNTKSGNPVGTSPLVPDSGSLGFLGFLGTPTPAFSKNEGGADCHHEWLVTHSTGERAIHYFAPAKSRAEVLALYPGALVEPHQEPEPRQLPPDALPLIGAYLDHIKESDPVMRADFIEHLSRDPARLQWLYAEAVRVGVAAPAGQQPEPEPPVQQAACGLCRHWTPNTIHPTGGLGRCRIQAPASLRAGSCWPQSELRCARYEAKP